ncbi:MAG: ATP-grasp domain-containing protein [bacterium]|nr:ATP-grasp domain-containing protein [bacterium]
MNRGEAATRCLRAVRELRTEERSELVGIALYTDPDRFGPFVREADEALALGPALRRGPSGAMRPAYLDHDRVLAALRATHADSVWPGWGFLAEAPDFVEKLEALDIAFLGPSAATMRSLGDKITSKTIAERAGVPVSPWSSGPVTRQNLREHVEQIGLPAMLKATAGGGGRGIRKLTSLDGLDAVFDSAETEAENSFGDGTLFVEKAIVGARHVEVQMAADEHGNVLALGLRDCSVQRKHQKVVEEAPPPGLPDALMSELREASVRLLREVGYTGVATCEYLVTSEGFYFLEVNPRLQVEHGVTELLTDVDLVKWQIKIARGDALPKEPASERGCAIEVRLCAEDPSSEFAPSPGRIALLDLPSGPGIRVDSGIVSGDSVPPEFDSMVAKILARGSTREEARSRLVRAVSDARVVVEGGMTNKGFLLDVLDHSDFRRGGVQTDWLDSSNLARSQRPCIEALLIAAIQVYQREREAVRTNFFTAAGRGRPREIPASSGVEIDLVYAGCPYRLRVFAIGGNAYRVYMGDRVMEVTLLEQDKHTRVLILSERRFQILISQSPVEVRIEIDGCLHRVESDVGGKVRAPAPALLIEIAVQPGDNVRAGQRVGLFEAMKTETALLAPMAGVVREVVARAGNRVSAGDVILIIEPSSGDRVQAEPSDALELPLEDDPLDVFFDADGQVGFAQASEAAAAVRIRGANALRSESRRLLMGYDVNPERADRLIQILQAPVEAGSDGLRAELSQLAAMLEIFADIEALFSRAPTRLAGDELGPSSDARLTMYLRRIAAEGAGIAPEFLDLLRRTLKHYDVEGLTPDDALERAVLRIYATRTTLMLRSRLVGALLQQLIRLGETGETFSRHPDLSEVLDRLAMLRNAVGARVADLATQARFRVFERPNGSSDSESASPVIDFDFTLVPPPKHEMLEERARQLSLSVEEVQRFEIWRLENFDLERIESPGFPGILAFSGRSRDGSGDQRILCFSEVTDLGPGVPLEPSIPAFEQRFHEAIEAMRSLQGNQDPARRMQWNRLYVFVRPPIVLSDALLTETLRRLSPETGHLGLEKVIVRIASVNPVAPGERPRKIEVLAGNPSGNRVQWSFREPHDRPLEPATPYERRVAAARARGLVYPYEIIRLFTAPPEGESHALGRPIGPGDFEEYDLRDGRAVRVVREPGESTCGVVFGVIRTPTLKHPTGMRRVLILGDPTWNMGALAAPECDRIVAALELARTEGIPVEWVAVSSGARIAMESGTENLDATARVVRKLVTFTDAGGEVNLILPGVNVGAQSYFDALATMGLQSKGILIMLAGASMVLTGRAALEFSGGVSAEDEVGIGGYERIMGPNGEAHHQARDLSDAYGILLEHHACSYRSPGERHPRPFRTTDPADRDVTQAVYEGEEDFRRVGDIFSQANAERKRPFAMRPLMRALVDADAGSIERWRDWTGAEMAITWDSHLGGFPIALVGIESRSLPRLGYRPNHGPESWTAGTLFPASSKKVARALNAASGNRAAVVLANLSGFDGSPESMQRGILEYGAEIARAVVRFEGPLLFVVVTRYHGGAYVVFSRELNEQMRASALSGSFASVIGGPAAAAVVFARDVRKRALADPRVREATADVETAVDTAARVARRARLDQLVSDVILEKQAELATEFDTIHSVERALEVGSLESLVEPAQLRPTLIRWLSEALVS